MITSKSWPTIIPLTTWTSTFRTFGAMASVKRPLPAGKASGVIYIDKATGLEKQAKGRGYDVRVGTFNFGILGRARIANETEGLVKIVAEKKYDEVVRELNVIRASLPEGITLLRANRQNPAQTNIVQMALVSETASYRRMEAYARELRDAVERADGVQQSEIWGVPTAEVRITPDLDKLANFLKQFPDRKLLIEGYTDSVGSDSYNQDLSDRRAQAVRDALVQRGVDTSRITARGYGKAHPVADNASPEGRAMNRRVEIVIADDKGNLRGR